PARRARRGLAAAPLRGARRRAAGSRAARDRTGAVGGVAVVARGDGAGGDGGRGGRQPGGAHLALPAGVSSGWRAGSSRDGAPRTVRLSSSATTSVAPSPTPSSASPDHRPVA